MDRAEASAADAAEKDPFNEIFYKSDPYNYLIQRVVSLIAMKDRGSDVLGLLPEVLEISGSEFGRIQPSDQTRTDQWRFVTAESEVILHHVSETLLRLYLAHVDRPERPWIVLARERHPGRFKELVGDLYRRIREDQEEESIHQVFHGARSRLEIGNPVPPSAEKWAAGAQNIADFLSHFAQTFLDPDPYNAVKHGLALAAGASRLELSVDQVKVGEASGRTIDYLTRQRTQKGHAQWAIQTKWIDPDQSLALSIAGCHLIRQLWIVARHVYVGERLEGYDLLDRLKLDDLDRERARRGITKVTKSFRDQANE